MEQPQDVKVFISWSGDLSKHVAVALRGWLPLLFDRVTPWVSDQDIEVGQRSLARIEAELEDTQFGIVVVTAANQKAPWLNFEAGAMSKSIGDGAEQRVVPLLVDFSNPTDIMGPLAQFQAKSATREGMLDIVRSLAEITRTDEGVIRSRFHQSWPDLEAQVEAAKAHKTPDDEKSAAPPPTPEQKIDEILKIVRYLQTDADSTAGKVALGKNPSADNLRFFIDRAAAVSGVSIVQYPGDDPDKPRELIVETVGADSYTKGMKIFRSILHDSGIGAGLRVIHIPSKFDLSDSSQ